MDKDAIWFWVIFYIHKGTDILIICYLFQIFFMMLYTYVSPVLRDWLSTLVNQLMISNWFAMVSIIRSLYSTINTLMMQLVPYIHLTNLVMYKWF